MYNILPHLRPKAPFHVRVLKAITFWRKEEVKVSYPSTVPPYVSSRLMDWHQREPFTVADVQRAKAELEARTQAAAAVCVVSTEARIVPCWWSQVQIPEIVIHPCDNTPLMYAEVAYIFAEALEKHAEDVSMLSLTSETSEADSPLSHTISVDEAAVAALPIVAADDVREARMLSVTARKEGEEEEVSGNALVINMSSTPEAVTSGDIAASTSETASSLAAGVEVDDDPKLQLSATDAESSTPLTPSESAAFPVASTPAMPFAPGMDFDPSYSPASTASEPDSPMPLTPIEESRAFPLIFTPTPAGVFDTHTPPSTIVADVKGKGKDVGPSTFEVGHYGMSAPTGPDSPLRVGLGLSFEEVQRREEEEPQFVIGELSPANSGDSIFDDSWNEASEYLKASPSTSSSPRSKLAGSVPDIRRVLNGSSMPSHEYSSKASPSGPSSPCPVRTPFAGILEVLKCHTPSSEADVFTVGTSSSDILHYYLDDEAKMDEDKDKDDSANASVASWRRRLL